MPADKSLVVAATPGPWGVDARRDGVKVRTKSGELICDCATVGRSAAKDRANARLIACAPLFREVLQHMINYQVDYSEDTEWNVRQLQLFAQRAITVAPK
jgi:hypothetical protein